MAEQTLDINVYTQTTIPNSLNELMDNHGKLQQISAYCKGAYAGPESAQIYEQTQSYAKNALMNVAYHIQTIGTHLTTLLQLQTAEVEKIDLKVKYLNQRVDMIHEGTGVNVFKTPSASKSYKSTLKERQVETEDIRPPAKFVRKQVAYSIGGDGVFGASGANNNNNLSNSQHLSSSASPPTASTPGHQSPPYQATPPPPAAVAQSKRTAAAPPPPPPPSMDVPSLPTSRPAIPQRSPSVGQNGHVPPPANFDFPPPPPSNFDFPPPPPPSFDFPPPPPPTNFDFPPPPPPSFDFPPPPPPN